MADAKVFVDTNVLVYAYDSAADRKREIAAKLLTDLWRSGAGVLSTQVLQEFYLTVTRKIPRPIDPPLARQIVEDLLTWDVVVNDGESILEAIDLENREKLSFWDALIVCAAGRGGAGILLSEDLPHGRVLKGVKIENPFL